MQLEISPTLVVIMTGIFVMLATLGFRMWIMSLENRRLPVGEDAPRVAGQSTADALVDAAFDAGSLVVGMVLVPIAVYALAGADLNGALPIFATVAALVVCSIALWRVADRFRHLRDGLLAERVTGSWLERQRPPGWFVNHDVQGLKFNLDHVLVGPGGVFVVETKSRRKPVRDGKASYEVMVDGTTLRFPGWTDTATTAQAQRGATWLAGELRSRAGHEVAVRPLVMLPGWMIKSAQRPPVAVLNPKNPYPFLEGQGRSLDDQAVARIAALVQDISRAGAVVRDSKR